MSLGNINFVDFTPPKTVPLHEVAIRLHPEDHVVIAKTNLTAGTTLLLGDDTPVKVRQFIPSGHKVAITEIARDAPLRRYGQIIGFATGPIQPGDHVHSHNLDVKDFARDYAFGVDVRPVDYIPEAERRTFMGYKRANGQVGTRNFIAIISSVNCSAHVSREIAHYFTPERLAAYPNVDGVIALTHSLGCANRLGGHDYLMLQRTLAGMARHANVGAYVLVGLGCETNQISDLVERHQLTRNGNGSQPPLHLIIQDSGGVRKTIEAGVAAVQELLPVVNEAQRTPQSISELMVGLECGGSDSWSGVTANPLLGIVSDEIVRQGGTTVLSETPEVYGA
jgi:altronate hydrolase